MRAYQAATQAGLAASRLIEKCKGQHLLIHTDYNGLGKLLSNSYITVSFLILIFYKTKSTT